MSIRWLISSILALISSIPALISSILRVIRWITRDRPVPLATLRPTPTGSESALQATTGSLWSDRRGHSWLAASPCPAGRCELAGTIGGSLGGRLGDRGVTVSACQPIHSRPLPRGCTNTRQWTSSMTASGRRLTSSKMRHTYSPITPSMQMTSPSKKEMIDARVANPGTS